MEGQCKGRVDFAFALLIQLGIAFSCQAALAIPQLLGELVCHSDNLSTTLQHNHYQQQKGSTLLQW